jgi:hypothetical protein
LSADAAMAALAAVVSDGIAEDPSVLRSLALRQPPDDAMWLCRLISTDLWGTLRLSRLVRLETETVHKRESLCKMSIIYMDVR